jgi:hypothetical protein
MVASVPVSRDTVFVAGGQPSITYVDRKHLDIDRALADAGVDWDDASRQLDIGDPYLRFFLRWQVRQDALAA